jgi:hypothetical protein
MSFGLLALKDILIIWLSNIWSLSVTDEGYYVPDEGYYVPDEGYYVPDEGYSRNVSCALNLICTFS